MTFLTKLGGIVMKVVGVALGYVPLVSKFLPAAAAADVTKAADKLEGVCDVVITAEQMFAAAGAVKAGSQKLAAATPFVAKLVQGMDQLAGKKPKDEVLFEKGCTDLTSAMAEILNSYGE